MDCAISRIAFISRPQCELKARRILSCAKIDWRQASRVSSSKLPHTQVWAWRMDDDDLFGVFEAKPKTFSTSAPPAPTSAVEDGETATAGERKRKKDEDGAGKEAGMGDLEKDDEEDDEEEGAEPPVKRREVEMGGEELCPAAGEGSVVIHDITSFNPELGRKAHRHQVCLAHLQIQCQKSVKSMWEVEPITTFFSSLVSPQPRT
jgi:hypothetical protein